DRQTDASADVSFRPDDEAAPPPRAWVHELSHEVDTEPTANGEARQRSDGEPDHRVNKSAPDAEEIAAQESHGLARDGGNDDLQGLEADEDERSQDAQILARLLEEGVVRGEANDELVGA